MKDDLADRDAATAQAMFQSKRERGPHWAAYDRCEAGTTRGSSCRNTAYWALIAGRWPGIYCKMHGEHMRAYYGGRLVRVMPK